MNDYVITTDSGCDLSFELYDKYEILPIMMEYELESTMYEDTPDDAKVHEFYSKMREGAAPKTTQVNADRMERFFEGIAKDGKNILHIALSSGISGTYHNCTVAAKAVMEKYNVKVMVLDSISASLAQGMLCIIASENRKSGMSLEQNMQALEDMRHYVRTYYTTNTLEYLHRGGRVSKTSAVLGQMLGINPVLTLDTEGKLIVCDKIRGEKKTFAGITKKIAGNVIDAQSQTLYISHSDCKERARAVGEQIKAQVGFKDVVITNIGTIIGAHTGPELIAIFYKGKERDNK